MPGSSYLVDTNILLRLVQPDSPEYGTIRQCTDRLWAQGADLFYTSQNMAEFWNVCTRPADRNGFGFSVAETDERATLIEAKFSFAADSEATHQEWRKIVVAAGVSGIQVHSLPPDPPRVFPAGARVTPSRNFTGEDNVP